MDETTGQKLDIIIRLLRDEVLLSTQAVALCVEAAEQNKERLAEVREIEARNGTFLAKNDALVDRYLAQYAMDDSRNLIASLLKDLKKVAAQPA